jgi:NADH-quinone oxidoreductase subunit I
MSGYFSDIKAALQTTLVGMRITWSHLFTRAVTIQYPDVKRALPDRVRNRLYVNMDDCIGCDQCAKACPVNCITIETVKALATEDLGETSTGNRKRLWVTTFDIDIGKCCYCGLCTFPCPTYCIMMTPSFEFSEYRREDLIYRFSTMTPDEVAEKKANAEVAAREAEAKKAAAAAAAARKKAEEAAAAAAAQAEQSAPAAPAPDDTTTPAS